MPLDRGTGGGSAGGGVDVAALNARFRHHSAIDVLDHSLRDDALGPIAMVSSFGAESVVLLHMIAVTQPHTPVLFLDTQMHFAETLVYQSEVSERLGLKDVRILSSERIAELDPHGTLHQWDTDACCDLRKTDVLNRALAPYSGWITGRKRYQGGQRAALDFFEIDAATGHLKINPLAHWDSADTRAYMDENRLPRHPLVAQGYPSIGCAPCTSRVENGEDPRAGRWRGQNKDECGIHIINGKVVRTGANA